MSGFMSGAIDPALLSGGGNTTTSNDPASAPVTDHNSYQINNTGASSSTYPHHSSLNPQSFSANPHSLAQTSSSPHAASFGSFSHHPNNHGLNLPSSSSSSSFQPPATTSLIAPTSLPNGSIPVQGTPTNNETPLSNGMSAKDQEMHQKDHPLIHHSFLSFFFFSRELAQFLLKMEEYKPVIPDEVAAYYLQKVGFECTDVKVQRLLVLACQKFVSDIAQDAFSYARTRTGQAPGGRQGPLAPNSNSAGLANGASNNNLGARKDRTRTVLTQEDLAQALAEYGINASRAPYYL
ncbi:hypothetical protein VP01_239g1 [Puccinia sorghi]|uniref:Transcription initiation factor TFIID subunit 10 n=1 Tax=Puccinia sorghi TaxID=27349 RepID=A0A0L6V6T1_9BASI|nr:hypothetical protein VP01_239g1 [Puccinia sorghi]